MTTSFFFYDLETSGVNPRDARVMQFAGQRTDMELNPIGDPEDILIKLSDDVVPEPDAIMITGITPQKTIDEGITEAEFLKIFFDRVATPGTVFVGFNSVRFDDEFMRYLLYRNFYDPYEWQYAEGRSRWDLLDVVRMTRALRPEGIEWPVDDKGKPTNRLELLTALNGISHENAHDALSDVNALIAVTRLIRDKQPKLFDYLLKLRDKTEVEKVVMSGQPFVYSSGKYDNEFEKTTAVAVVAKHPKRPGALVFDLRHDPTPFAEMTAQELADAMRRFGDDPGLRLPVKTLQFNRCPAVAPFGVLDAASQERLKIDTEIIEKHRQELKNIPVFAKNVLAAIEILDAKQQLRYMDADSDVDARLYDGFFDRDDKTKMSAVRAAGREELGSFNLTFKDSRLEGLLPLYKARNFPQALSDDERRIWEQFRVRRLLGGKEKSRLAKFFTRLGELAQQPDLTPEKQFLLEELQLYGQSIVPLEDD